ncbi:unnamed protein product [Discula destructiva]
MFFKLITILLAPLALAVPFSPEVQTQAHTRASAGITQFRYSGSGCTQGSDSVGISSSGWTTQVYTFSDFYTSSTENCELHFQGSGLSSGYQVSLAELDAVGKTTGPVKEVDWYWQGYWSDDASDTLTLSGTVFNPSGTSMIKANVSEPVWSKCIGADGNPGILNVNFRVVVAGDGSFEVLKEMLKYQYRKCQ